VTDAPRPVPWDSFAALGDSFTEGVDDLLPDGSYGGWADRVAERLAADRPGFRYANLAVRGRLLPRIVAEQVPVALRLRPSLVSLVGGVNDMLRPSFDPRFLERVLDHAVRQLQDGGSTVVLLVGVNPTVRSRLLARLMPRVEALNDAVQAVAERRGTITVDLFGAAVFDDRRLWSPDRLHLGPLGHERVAGAYLEAVGLGDGTWRDPVPGPLTHRWDPAEDAAWARAHLAPWVGRRVRGRSSGEEVHPKRPTLSAVRPGDDGRG
jgi:lysophospholipase L1-like esterase